MKPASSKLCVDCKWFKPWRPWLRLGWPKDWPKDWFAKCLHPSTLDIVTGEVGKYARTERRDYFSSETCGTAGKNFEAGR